MQMILVVLWVLLVTPAWATDYFVSKSGSDANSCAAAQSSATPKLTILSALGCESAGDTILIGDGTYTDVSIGGSIAAGTSVAARTTIKAINRRQVILKPASSTTGGHVILLSGKPFVAIDGLVIDADDVTNDGIKLDSASTDVSIHDVEVRNSSNQGILITKTAHRCSVTGSWVHHNGTDSLDHGMYVQAEDCVVEGNELSFNAQMGLQFYEAVTGPSRGTFRRNYVHANCQATGSGSELFVAHLDHVIERNMIVVTGSCTTGVTVSLKSPSGNTLRQNSIVCLAGACSNGININSPSANTTVQNNIVLGFGTAINNNGTGTTLTDNLTAGTTTDIWTNPATHDLTLKAGSAAINGGTDIGLPFCGSHPDQGAFERPEITAASINGNTMDLTVCSVLPPMQLNGTWTPGCTGSGCGSRTVDSTSVLGSGIVRHTISGAPCTNVQTWTITGSGATDSALVGNQFNQAMKAETSFAVDGAACSGSGPTGPPAGALAIYNFETNTNDSSGNAHHATGSASISYAAGHDMQGVNTTSGVDSYVDTGLLSGHNPTTTHLFVGLWVRINQLSVRRMIGGVALGTDQRFYIRQDSDNVWDFATQAVVSPTNTEFPVVAGDTFIGVKFRPSPTNTATLCVNGVEGVNVGSSVQNITSYAFPSTFRLGLPSGFATSLSSNHIFDQLYIYSTDVSCADVYNGTKPPPAAPTMTQVAHQWQGVYKLNGNPEGRGAVNEQRKVVQGGAAAVVVQLDCVGGNCDSTQPQFWYNINGGLFSHSVPDQPTADGVSFWGADITNLLNSGSATGPLSGSLTHINGITKLTSLATPTIDLDADQSYTLRGIFRISAVPGTVVCFKAYDQGGSPLSDYTPDDGACLTVVAPQAIGGP